MENDLSLSQALGGLRIANPDYESSPSSPTETSSVSQQSALKAAANDCSPNSRRISLFNLPFLSRGSSSTESSSLRTPSQNNDHRLSQHYLDTSDSVSLKSTNESSQANPRKAEVTKTYRQSLPNNYLVHQNTQFPSHESNRQNFNSQKLSEDSSRLCSGTQLKNQTHSLSTENLGSQRLGKDSSHSSVSGISTQIEFKGQIDMKSGVVNARDANQQDYLFHQNYSQSTGNVSVPPRIAARGIPVSHYDLGSSIINGTMISTHDKEATNASVNEDLKDKGATLGLREECDTSGKIVPRQVKKGVRDFIFGQPLGEGSYSQVVLGTDRLSLKEYAIKILDKKHIIKEKKVKYVNIEKDTLNRLIEHPGIVRLYYTFQDNTSLYYVLDVASGGELLGFLKKIGSFDEECTRFYGAQILDAIEHMHNRGVIHRDLKPENVLMDDKMHIKITDFGTAKLLPDPRKVRSSNAKYDASDDTDESIRAKSFVGTAEYVSPELLTEKSACKASDLWAFGCIIYQLLTGRPPFKAGNDYQTFQKIVNLEFEYPQGFPRIAKDLVDRLLVLDPQKRLTIEHIKVHAFFEGIQWGRALWKQKAPRLKPYMPPPPEPSIIKLNSHRSNLCPVNNTRSQKLPSLNGHSRPQPRVITELPPPTQLDIEWSPVLKKNNERILKLGNLTVVSSPFPFSPNSRHGDQGDGHERRKISRFFSGNTTKKRQRLVMVTSSARIILAAAGGEEKKLKAEISLLASECFWRTQVDSKGQEVWSVYTNGMYYTFEDAKNSVVNGDPFRSSATEWIESLERAKEMALFQSGVGSYNSDTGFELTSAESSSNGTLLGSSIYSESTSINDHSSRGHITKNQSSLCIDDAEHLGKKSRFSKRQSKNGLSTPF